MTPVEIENGWFLWTAIIPVLFTLLGFWGFWISWKHENSSGWNAVGALFKSLGILIVVLLAWLVWGTFYSSIVVMAVGQ